MDEEYVQSAACIFNNCSETCRGSLTCFMQHNHGPPTVFHFLMCRSNARFNNTFLQTSTDFQGEKNHPGNNLCTDSHTLVKREHHRWYCNTSTFKARSMSNGQITTLRRNRVETGMRQILFISYSAEPCTSGKSLALSNCLYLMNVPQPFKSASSYKGSIAPFPCEL